MRVGQQVAHVVRQARARPQASKLEQYWLTVSLDTLLPAMWNIVEQQASVPNSKIIVFFVTARCTQFFAEFFNSGGIEVMEIHSRKSQSARSKTSERFRNAKQAVLFTSDVSGTGPTHPTPCNLARLTGGGVGGETSTTWPKHHVVITRRGPGRHSPCIRHLERHKLSG